jgi:ribose 5-phosphate isomerase B
MATIALGCDEAGLPLLDTIRDYLRERNIPIQDFGVHSTDPVDYPDIAVQVAESVANGECERAILVCGTGIGMSITANRNGRAKATMPRC